MRKEGRETGRVKERRGEETRRGGGRDGRSWECGGQEVRDGERGRRERTMEVYTDRTIQRHQSFSETITGRRRTPLSTKNCLR